MATLRELVTKLAFKVDRAALKLAAKLMDNVGKSAEDVAKKTEKAERAKSFRVYEALITQLPEAERDTLITAAIARLQQG